MEVVNIAFNALVSPTAWIPGIGAAVFLTRLTWWQRSLAGAAATFVIGLVLALVLTPSDPGNWVRLAGVTIAGAMWTIAGMFVVWGTQPGTRE